MPNKLGLSVPEMPDSGPGSTGFPSNARDDLLTLSTVAERRGTVFPTDLLDDGDKFYKTDENQTYEYHLEAATWVPMMTGVPGDPSAAVNTHKLLSPIDHPNGSVTTAKIGDNQVTTAKLPDNAITDPKIGTRTRGAVTATLSGWIASLCTYFETILGGGLTYGAVPPITLTGARAHTDAYTAHAGNATLTGVSASITAHNAAQAAHNILFGASDPTGATVAAIGSLYRQTTTGHLWERVPTGSGWARVGVGMTPSLQRGLIVMDATEYSHVATIAAVNPALAEVRMLGLSSSEAADDLQNNPLFLAVRLEMTSPTQLTATRNYRSDNPPASTIISWEVTNWV